MHAADQRRLLADVEEFCQELREHEELAYVEHRFNHHLIPLAQKYNLMGMIVPPEYGGRGADTGRRSCDDRYFFAHTVATGVAGEPTAPGSLSGGAVSRKRLRLCARSQFASSVRYQISPR